MEKVDEKMAGRINALSLRNCQNTEMHDIWDNHILTKLMTVDL